MAAPLPARSATPPEVVHVDGVVGNTDPGLLEPLDPSHMQLGHLGLTFGHPVGVVQQGVQESADAVGVQVPRMLAFPHTRVQYTLGINGKPLQGMRVSCTP